MINFQPLFQFTLLAQVFPTQMIKSTMYCSWDHLMPFNSAGLCPDLENKCLIISNNADYISI